MIKIEKMNIELTGSVNMNFNDMEFKELMILVGTNGSGKSLILKFNFLLGFIGNAYFLGKNMGYPQSAIDLAKFAVKHTFKKPDFDGFIEGLYSSGISIRILLKNGEVDGCFIGELNPNTIVEDFPAVKFLSAGMRTFDDIEGYLKLRKRICPACTPQLTEQQTLDMLEDYRLYDLLYLESLINKESIPLNSKVFENYGFRDDQIPTSMRVSLEECDFIASVSEGKEKYLTTYSKGEQSLINMFAGSTS